MVWGLSPRVRGNRIGYFRIPIEDWSIPACAGEPWVDGDRYSLKGVYPRVCGGTPLMALPGVRPRGLSPRVRGNPHPQRIAGESVGSIPACAGEPRPAASGQRRPAVYPRVCGGTRPVGKPALRRSGLSPRVRGNPGGTGRWGLAPGSIPACAGEPNSRRLMLVYGKVYPRVCGGTKSLHKSFQAVRGLSPRVRGNRPNGCAQGRINGSIPACAGEPSWNAC